MSSLQIDQHGRFFSKLQSKEASAANSSSRVLYYGGAACSVPFLWETCPGTPKRKTTTSYYSLDSADECKFKPFLTPPPYYGSFSGSKLSENGFEAKVRGGPRFLSMLVRKLRQKRLVLSPMCSVSSPKSLPSLSLVASYPLLPWKTKWFGERYVCCSSFDGGGKDNDVVGRDKGSLSSASKL